MCQVLGAEPPLPLASGRSYALRSFHVAVVVFLWGDADSRWVPSQVTVWIEAPCAGPGVAGAEPYGDVPVTVGGCVRPVLQGLLRDRK